MSSPSIVCVTCNAAVPYGRLSCPTCGELLASVVGAARPAIARTATKRVTRRADAATVPAVLVDGPPPSPAAAMPASAAAWTLEDDPPTQETPDGPVDAIDRDRLEWPVAGTGRDPYELSGPAREPAVFQAATAEAAGAPGAYVPPLVAATPAGPAAPARAWAGQPGADVAMREEAGARPTASELLDAARLPEFIGWLTVAGAALAAVGFALPWGISVIGARGVGYFDRWGLAGPFHPIVFVGLLALLGLSLVRNPIPLRLRVGVPGLGLGALVLGLIWPYLVGLSGTGPGAVVVALGATILVTAGVAALVTDRHAIEDRAV